MTPTTHKVIDIAHQRILFVGNVIECKRWMKDNYNRFARMLTL